MLKKDSSNINVDLVAQIDPGVDLGELQKVAEFTLKQFCDHPVNAAIVIADDKMIIETNEKYLNSSSVTDVISFDLSDADCARKSFDIIVNAEQAKRQSKERGISLAAELALYIVHGLLHNCGFDDINEQDAVEMHRTEDEILTQNGFGNVYFSSE